MRLTDAQVRAVMDEKIDRVNERVYRVLTSVPAMLVYGVAGAWAYLKWAGFIK